MACSKPNLIGHDARYKGIAQFYGARHKEKHLWEYLNDYVYHVFDVPCGKCDMCLIERRYSNATLIMLEASMWPGKTFFFTLTFDNDHLGNGELDKKEFAQFAKDFRRQECEAKYCKITKKKNGKEFSYTHKKVKFVQTGEYGDQFGRKHFHGIIFNHDFTDIYDTGFYSDKGNKIYSSKRLREIWKKGNVQIEEITYDLALYVGSYITDKSDDIPPDSSYKQKQYGRLGNHIGYTWLKKYWLDVLSAGKVMLHDADYPIPRKFHQWLARMKPIQYAKFKSKRFTDSLERRERQIKKGYGPLAIAQAKGRIQKTKHKKRKLLNEKKEFSKAASLDV